MPFSAENDLVFLMHGLVCVCDMINHVFLRFASGKSNGRGNGSGTGGGSGKGDASGKSNGCGNDTCIGNGSW